MLITMSILQTIGNILIFLIVLSLVINIHELGHFFFAKRAGILCHEFSFGMGPRLWSKKFGETIFSIRAIPFGGFVSMAGEEIESDIVKVGQKIRLGFDRDNLVNRIVLDANDSNYGDFLEVKVESFDLSSEEGTTLHINDHEVKRTALYVMGKKHIQITPKDRSFVYKSKWQRFLATFGGPLMNFILAFVVFLIIGFIVGVPDYDSTRIGEVDPSAPAATILEEGDIIRSINGVDITSWNGETNSVNSELNSETDHYIFVVERDGQLITLDSIEPQYVFYGLGFTSDITSDDVVIGTPLYISTLLAPGDKVISIDGVAMNSWDDVIAFANGYLNGSTEEDPTSIVVFREKSYASLSGTVVSITLNTETNLQEVVVAKDDCGAFCRLFGNQNETLFLAADETLLIDTGSQITEGEQIGELGTYTIEYVAYGTDVLDAMGYDVFYSRVGIVGSFKFSFFGSFGSAWTSFSNAGTSIFKTIGLLFSSNQVGVGDLSGFVGIFSMTSQAAAGGLISLLGWIGLLSVNLGIVNLLPIPALDGGRLVFIAYEAVTKRKPNQKFENMLHTIMFFLLMALLIFITYNDILRLFGLK